MHAVHHKTESPNRTLQGQEEGAFEPRRVGAYENGCIPGHVHDGPCPPVSQNRLNHAMPITSTFSSITSASTSSFTSPFTFLPVPT